MSNDGCLDDTSPRRLVLSGPEDWEEVYALRARCDAILVGAETLRRDDPSLRIKTPEARRQRLEAGLPEELVKIVVSGSAQLDEHLRFFTVGAEAPKIVITCDGAPAEAVARLARKAEVITLPRITAHSIRHVLAERGIRNLLVEGGARTIGMFMAENAIDEFRMAVAPFRVDDSKAPHLPCFGCLPFEGTALKTVRNVGRMTVYHYDIRRGQDEFFLRQAVDESRKCIKCHTAYAVGCVLVSVEGEVFKGYTHETSPTNHAEEEAIAKAIRAGVSLQDASIYTSMEPCSTRASKPVSCFQLILRYGIGRVVYARAEPDCFVKCRSTEILRNAGIEVTVIDKFAAEVEKINAHILNK